jgi:hypothetical protein
MSLTMMALRICAVQALKAANTLVGTNVLDSEIAAIDQTADGALRSDQQLPFIAVYTDAANASDIGQTGMRTNGRVEILINAGVTMTRAETDRDTGAASIVEGLPATDAHFEAVLDVLDAQIGRALSDPESLWAQAFGGLVSGYVSKHHLRSASTGNGVRLAAAQTKLVVDVFADPRHGQPIAAGGPWSLFMTLLETHGLSHLTLFQQMLGEADIGPYAEFERLTGMTVRDADSLTLYTYGGVGREIVVTDPQSMVTP